tara:strand:- start:493 stop:873 length:381 start_codon:yes stop_codon:yes gene_type:complete
MAKILLIDDSKEFREQMGKNIEEAGHEVILADCGEDGLAKAKENTDVDLILTDYVMPDFDGLELTKQINQIEALSKTPILMVTEASHGVSKDVAKKAGLISYVSKSSHNDHFVDLINKILVKTKSA